MTWKPDYDYDLFVNQDKPGKQQTLLKWTKINFRESHKNYILFKAQQTH